MKIFKISALALCLLALTIIQGCGYKVAGFDSPVKFYIEKVVNNTIDVDYGETIQQAIDSYFIIYGEMSDYKRAEYILNITLDTVTLSDNIVSATNESVNSNIIIDISIVVTDKQGKEIFSYRNKPAVSFNITQSIADTIKNRNAAIKEATTDTLDIFRSNFNSAFL